MHIDIIETLPSMAKLEDNWNAVYDADDEAQIFLSWQWLHGWLSYHPGTVVHPRGQGRRGRRSAIRRVPSLAAADYNREVRPRQRHEDGGRLCRRLHRAWICRPEAENKVIPAFARYVRQMDWARLNLDNVRMSERRARLLLACFPKASFNYSEANRITRSTESITAFARTSRCRRTGTAIWNAQHQYTAEDPAPAEAGRHARRVSDNHCHARDVYAGPQDPAGFWETKWRPRKGKLIDGLVQSNGAMLTRSFQSGTLYMPTFWHGDRPSRRWPRWSSRASGLSRFT